MDSREFLEQVDWETNIYDVRLFSEETELVPAKWIATVKPKDQNDKGSDIPIEIDYYLIDNMGNQFRIIDNEYLVAGDILVSDDFRCGWCPQPDLTGLIVKSVGNGAAPHVSSAKLDRLDKVAKEAVQNREKDILWKHPKDINEKWHPEGLLFTADPTDNKIINWVDGKIFITLWPENLISDYVFDNDILGPKNNYHPERVYTFTADTFTCPDDELHYIYAVLPLDISILSGSIVIEKTYRPERYYTDMLTILLGTYTIPDGEGKRIFLFDWSGGINGKDGIDGTNGTDGSDGTNGVDGQDGNGISSIVLTSTIGLIKTYIITFTDSSTFEYTVTDGTDGADGNDGLSGSDGIGIVSIVLTNTVGLIDTYTITFTDSSTTTFNVTNGADGYNGIDGSNGLDGADGNGIALVTLINTVGLVKTYRITFTDATTFDFDVADGADGSIPLEVTGLTLLSTGWTLVSGFYEYDLANANITATSAVDVIPAKADIAIVKAADIMPETLSSAGSVKLYATNAPTGNIGVTIIITEVTT